MKWFKHLTDSHTNFKHRKIINELGMEGYGVYWLCIELVGQQGKKYCIKGHEDWKIALKDLSKVNDENLEKFLTVFAQSNLICAKALERGDLSVPKMKDYADEYSVRISRQPRENVVLDKIRIDKIRLEYNTLKGLALTDYSDSFFGRTGRAIKTLVQLAGDQDELVIEGLRWISKQNYEWQMETLINKWAEFKAVMNTPDILRKFTKKEK